MKSYFISRRIEAEPVGELEEISGPSASRALPAAQVDVRGQRGFHLARAGRQRLDRSVTP